MVARRQKMVAKGPRDVRVHPAVHATWLSALFFYLTRLEFISDLIEKMYERTAWLRDLLRWKRKKSKKRRTNQK